MERDLRIDEKIATAAPFARPILDHLRALVHRAVPGAGEAIKWGMPHFTYDGKNIAAMAGFKAHCAFSIHGESHEGEGMGTIGKITSLDDLPADAELIARLQAARARIDRGEKDPSRRTTPKPEIGMPDDFAAALKNSPAAQAFFDRLSPSARYDYLEWITGARQVATRERRIAQAIEWLAEGKRRNWKYER